MNYGILFALVKEHLNRTDLTAEQIANAFRLAMTNIQSSGMFLSFRKIAGYEITKPEGTLSVEVPSDFRDDQAVTVRGKDIASFSPVTCLDHYKMAQVYGVMLSSQIVAVPSIPVYYTIAIPQDMFADLSETTQKHIFFYPPCQKDCYVQLYYLANLVPAWGVSIPNTYTNIALQKFPNWVLYEVLSALTLLIKDFPSAEVFQAYALKAREEAFLAETNEILTPQERLLLKKKPQLRSGT